MTRDRGVTDELAAQFVAIITTELERREIPVRDFAAMLGITRQAVSDVLRNGGAIRTSTMVQWLDALGLDPTLVVKKKKRTQTKE